MTHVSDLVLDELASGLPIPSEAERHLASCEPCGARRQALERIRARALDAPEFRFTATRLSASAAARPRRWGRWVGVAGVLCAASVALLLLPARPKAPPEIRLKGAPTVALERGPKVHGPFRVGETVTLTLGSGGHAYALVFERDSGGEIERLWPTRGDVSAPTRGKARAALATFTLTPGDFDLIAVFSDVPLAADGVTAALRKHTPPANVAARVKRHVVVAPAGGGP